MSSHPMISTSVYVYTIFLNEEAEL
jgi:hypothetical protein